jgi:hypothetical protein
MTTRILRQALIVGIAFLATTVAANAYHFRLTNNTQETVVYINMHTVSVFCRDVSWSGEMKPGASMVLSSASICLVDGVYVKTKSGIEKSWSGVGLTGGEFAWRNGQLSP